MKNFTLLFDSLCNNSLASVANKNSFAEKNTIIANNIDKRLLLMPLMVLVLLFTSGSVFGQTTFSWRNDQNPPSGAWNTSLYWWNGTGPQLPGGGEILFLDGNVATTMTNDLPSTNRYRISFGATTAASRTINGTTTNAFYDFSNTIPAIANLSGVAHTINFPFQIGNTSTSTSPQYGMEINASSGNLNIGSTISAQNATGTKVLVLRASSSGTGTITLSGIISDGSGTIALSKIESNTAVLSAANTYTGATTVTGGTLRLGASGVIPDASSVNLNGGTLSTGTTGFNETAGTLNVSANSTIALGTGAHTLTFANSSAISWTATANLNITGWSGTYNGTSNGTTGKIFVGSNAAGLTSSQLARIYFFNGTNYFTAIQLSTGEVVPTATIAMFWGATGTTNTWNAGSGTRWDITNISPTYATAWVTGRSVVFNVANSLITGSTTTLNVASITANENVTFAGTGSAMSFGPSGGAVAPIFVASGKTFDFGTVNLSTGAGNGIVKNGPGTLVMTNGNGYPGGFTLNDGLMAVGTVNAMGNGGTLTINGGTIGTINPRAVTARYGAGGIVIGGNFTIGATGYTSTFSFADNVSLGASTRTITLGAAATQTFSGVISGSSSAGLTLAATAAGTLVISGANTYPGATTIGSSATLRLGATNAIPVGNPGGGVTFTGGTLSTGATTGFSNGASSTNNMGTITLSASSTIALGTGNHSLYFSGASFTAGQTLTISGWAGSPGASGTGGKIFIGNSASLTSGQLAQISFSGVTGSTIQLSTGEIVPSGTIYESITSGTWATLSTWRSSTTNGASWTSPATVAPSSTDGVIRIKNGHTVTVGISVTIDQVVVESGATLDQNGAVTLTIADGAGTDLDVSGTFIHTNNTITNSGQIVVQSGGLLRQAKVGTAIPTATWNSGSTCEVTGWTTTNGGGLDQSFSNFTWNCASQSASIILEPTTMSVGGLFKVSSTGAGTDILALGNTATTRSLTVGSLQVSGGRFAVAAASASAVMTLTVSGNCTIDGGSLQVSRTISSANSITVNGTTTISSGNLFIMNSASGSPNTNINTATLIGNVLVNGGTIDLVPTANDAGIARLLVRGDLALQSGAIQNTRNTTSGTTGIYFDAASGTQTFTHSGGTLSTASGGIGRRFYYRSTTGPSTINEVYSAGAAQNTVNGSEPSGFSVTNYSVWPTANTPTNNVTINNTLGGVTLSNSKTIGTLTLTSGTLDIAATDLTTGSISGGSSTTYVKTSSTGQLRRTVGSSSVTFPVGNSAYNPISFANTGTSDTYGVRVVDGALSSTNDVTKTINRRWEITEGTAGGGSIIPAIAFNSDEKNNATNFDAATTPYIGIFTTSWAQIAAAASGSILYTANSAFTPTTSPYSFGCGKDNGLVAIACTQPTTQASAISFSNNTTNNSVTVSWTRGNGSAGVILVARATSVTGVDPTNGSTYTANAAFGTVGTTTGANNFVVYSGTGTNVDVTGLTAGTGYTFTLYEYNTTGTCYATPGLSGTVTVCSTATASAGSALSAICQLGTSAAMGGSVGGATGGTWSGGAGSWTNASDPSTATYTAGASETGSITLTLTTTGGCSVITATKTITVNASPTVSAGSALSAICQSGTSAAMGGSVGGGATGGTWSGGAGSWTNASDPSTATYTAGASETGSITLTLTTSGGSCSTTTATKTITVNANPTATSGSALSAICQSGTSAAMGGSVGGGATSGTWTGGDGSWTNASNPSTATYTAGASETGSITLTLTTSGGSCSTTTATKTITVNANPTVSGGSALSAICQSGTSAAMGGSVGGGATGGTWTGGDGSWTNASDPSTATYTAGASETGSITLTLTTNGGSCSTTSATKTITVNANPTVSAGSALSAICQSGTSAAMGGSVGGGATGGTWTGGAGSWTNANNPSSATYTAGASETGGITLTLTTSGGSCSTTTATKTITVNQSTSITSQPTAQEICSGSTATFSVIAGGSSPTYAWRKRGSGWGSGNAWSLNANGGGFFVGSSNANGGGSSGIDASSKAFGLFNATNATADVTRNFSSLQVGQTFQVDIDNGFIDTGKTVGVALQNSSNNNVWEFYFTGGQSSYTINAASVNPTPSIPYTANGLRITLRLTSSTAYTVTIQALNGGATYGPFTGSLLNPSGGQSITKFRAFNFNAGTGANYDFFFNNLTAGNFSDDAAAYTTTSWVGNSNLGQGPLVNGATGTGSTVSNAATASLSIASTGSSDLANYDVVVYNSCGGQTTSTTAALTYKANVAISSQPTTPSSTCNGSGTQTLSVTASGSGLTYSWRKDGVALSDGGVISGQGTASLTLTNPTTSNAGSYDVVVSGTCTPAVTSNAVTVTVLTTNTSITPLTTQNIAISADGTELTVSEGSNSVTSREWKYSTISGSGYQSFSTPVTGTTYTPNFALGGTYYVVCQTTYGSPCSNIITSNEVQINVISNSITTGTVSGAPFCAGASGLSVPFTYSSASNFPVDTTTFKAQLSNASGSFVSPVDLQTVASDASGSQSISVTIPVNTAQGSGYRIRIVSDNPPLNGSNNGVNITINATSVGGTATATSSALCTGNATTVSLAGFTGSIQWQQSADGSTGWANVTGGSGATSATYTTPNLTATTYYRAVVTNGTCTSVNSSTAAITVDATSAGGSINSTSICLGSSSGTLTLTGSTGTVTKWQSSVAPFSTWSDIASTSGLTSYTSGALTQTTKYRAVVTNGACASANSSLSTVSVDQSNADSSAYSSSWASTSDDATTGFNSWILTTSGSAGHFTGNSDIAVIKAWGMFANSGGLANAIRPFTSNMTLGTTLNFSIDNGSVQSTGTVGFSLRNSSSQNLMEFYSVNGGTYTINDGTSITSSGVAFTTSGLNISITYTAANTYSMSVTPAAGGATTYFTGRTFSTAAAGQVPREMRFFNSNAGAGSGADYYINKLSLNRTAIGAETNFAAQTLCQNATANTLSVTAYGTDLTYQWYQNTSASTTSASTISGAASSSYTPSTASAGTLYYYCIVSGTCSSVRSNFSGAVSVSATPTTANAGDDQTNSATCGLTSVTLAGNTPTVGTGLWSIISGLGGTITSTTSPNSTFTGVAGTTYTLRWTISNSSCAASTDDVVITFNQNPTAANAGLDQIGSATCGLTSVTLAGNTPTVGTGEWTIVSGSGGTITSSSSPTSTFTGAAGTNYTLRWTISNSPCTASTDDVVITFNRNPTTANAGTDQTVCSGANVTLAATPASEGSGVWTIISGTGGTIATSSSPTSTFTGTAGTTYTLRWTTSNSPCTASTDDVTIIFDQNPTTANAGADQTVCSGATVTLAANSASVGTGAWSIVSGSGGTITSASSPISTFTGVAGTPYTLRWTISNGVCSASTDDVVIIFNENPTTANAGLDQTVCSGATVTLAATPASVGSGAWSIISGTGGTITTTTSATSTFSGASGTSYTLRWTTTNSPCTASTDDVVITFSGAISYGSVAGINANSNLVISQVYGGGGNASATYRNDFVEIFNPTNSTVSLSGWSIQYSSSGSTSVTLSGAAAITNLSGSIAAGKYLLVAMNSGGTIGTVISADITNTTTNMSATNGKVWLCNSTTGLTIGSGGCSTSSSIVDFVGYGTANCYEGSAAATAPSATNALIRNSNGCTDSNNNSSDFAAGTSPSPRNSASAANDCSGIVETDCSGDIPTAMSVSGASGSGSFTYQWYSQSGQISAPSGSNTSGWTSLGSTDGANTASYTPSVGVSATATYACFVTPAGSPSCGTGTWATSCRQLLINSVTGGTVAGSTAVCSGGNPVAFTESVTSTGSGTLTYQWESSASSDFSTTITTIAGATSTTYDVPSGITATTYYRRKATSALNGKSCSAYSNVLTVTVNALPTISGTTSVCVNATTQLAGSGSPAASNAWAIVANPTKASVSSTGLITGLISGTPSPTVTYTDINGCTSAASTITVNALPSVTFTSSPAATLCSATSAIYTTQSGQTNYVWSVPGTLDTDYTIASGGIGASSNTVTINWLTSGSKTVTVNYTNSNGCTATSAVSSSTTITLSPTSSNAGNAQTICPESSATLAANTPTTGTGSWSVTSGPSTLSNQFSSTSSATATFTPASGAGSYVLTWTITNGSCTSTSNVAVTVNNAPPPTSGVSICQDAASASMTVTSDLTNIGTTFSGTWTTTPIAFRPTSSIANKATCDLSTTITRNYTAIQFQVSLTGSYTFEMDNNASYDGMAYLTSGSFTPGSCVTGTWIRGDDDGGIAGNEPLITNSLTAGVTYTLYSTTFSATSGTYIGSFSWTVTPPSGGQIIMANTVNWYTASSGGTSLGTGTSFNPVGVANSGLANTATAGTTTYYAAFSNNTTCRTATNYVINASPSPSFTASPSSAACINTDVTYTTQSGQSNYIWSVPGTLDTDYSITSGSVGTSSNTVTLKWLTSGSKTVTVNYTNSNSCSSASAASSTITVSPASVGGSILGSTTVCTGTNSTGLTLSGNTGSVTKWQSSTVSDFSSAVTDISTTTTSLTASDLIATTYYRAVVNSGECSSENSSSATITVSPASVGGSISGSTTVCTGTNSSNLILSENTGSVTKWQSSTTSDFSSAVTDIDNTTTSLTATNLTATTYYRAVVTSGACSSANSSSASVTVSNANTWTGATSTAWTTASNWSCGQAPTSATEVTIGTSTNNPIITSDVAINSLTINSGATLTVNSTFDLTVTDVIINNGTLTIENNANLLQTNNVSNTGSGATIVKRNSSLLKRLDYTLWSSPVTGQEVYDFSKFTLPNRFYVYNTANDSYSNSLVGFDFDPLNFEYPSPLVSPNGVNGTDDANVQFENGKGYLIRVPYNHPTNPTVYPGVFTGVANNGNITANVSTALNGYNAVGNPYPSRLNVWNFIDGNTNITGPLYFWRKTNSSDPLSNAYATLTKIAYTANGSPGGDTGSAFFPSEGSQEQNWVINVGQGFIVKATSGSTINFTNSMRRSLNDNQFFKNDQTVNTVNNGLYWLNLNTSSGSYSQMAVGYSSEATLAFDRGIDGENINKEFYLTSLIGIGEYSIQGRPDFDASDVVPLSYKASVAGNYTISIDHTDGLFTDASQPIYIKDNATATYHDLQTGAYSFASAAGTFSDRLEIVYTVPLGIENPLLTANNVIIYSQNNEFVVKSGNIEMSSIKIFDIRGRLLEEKKGINATQATIGSGLVNQVLLVQITSVNGITVTKKVIR